MRVGYRSTSRFCHLWSTVSLISVLSLRSVPVILTRDSFRCRAIEAGSGISLDLDAVEGVA